MTHPARAIVPEEDGPGSPPPSASALAQRNLFEVFDERDPEARARAAEEIYSGDIEFHDPEGTVRGREAVAAKAGALLDDAPGFAFSLIRARQNAGTVSVLDWAFGPDGGDPVVTGTDVVLVADGRIRSLHTLLDT
ncbi:nuclear transport factor 2 family protein [Actinomycetospora flava]|uniref:Nuclear transport factor 2 family protein n=1 Tax=Actinomycetospora flava TaxID=3129232 RepID=A0ABU8M9K3_9PSEU